MKRIALHRATKPSRHSEAGFTLTELVAGLLVASMLIVGLADITRRYAMTTNRVREAAVTIRATQLVQNLMSDFERADPDSLDVGPDRLSGELGAGRIEATLTRVSESSKLLVWKSPRIERSIRLPGSSRFEETATGAVTLLATPGEPPLATVQLRRTAPFDCKYDTVVRECR